MSRKIKSGLGHRGVDLIKLMEGQELKPGLSIFGKARPAVSVSRVKNAQGRVEDLNKLHKLAHQSIAATFTLFRSSFTVLPPESVDFLQKKILDFTENVFRGQRIEFERQMGKHGKLRQLWVKDFNALVFYTYAPSTPDEPYLANGDPGYPGDCEQLDLVSVYIEGQDVMSLLPSHCLVDLTEECLREEHHNAERDRS